ncbi:hypothetical protein H4R18_003475 [Coemansia javaensis]|uniref:Uncharacterized protein n=1 Tax=Coemansia javaensis TaxID=2761396 RepID=A0A9W8HBX8_9FUNG|nr:hypothetical protein H4R18_003475 [Coemansia javaensis]
MVLNAGEVARGLALALEAAAFAARNRRVQRRFVDALKVTAVGMGAAHALVFVAVFLPLALLQAGNRVSAAALGHDPAQNALALLSTRQAMDHFLSTLPLLALDIVVHVRPGVFSGVFFAALDEADPEYAAALRSWPRRRFRWARIRYAAQRLAKRYLMTLAAAVLGRVPYVGWLVAPAGSVAMMARFVGVPAAGAVAALAAVSRDSRRTALFVFKSLLASRGLARDLLRPYFAHLGAKPEQQAAFYRANESALVGFILAFYLVVQLSWIGPAFFILAQAAAALFVARRTARPPPYTPGAAWEFADRPAQ